MDLRHLSSEKRTPAWLRRLSLFAENEKAMKRVEWAAIALFLVTVGGTYFLLSSSSGRTDFISPPLTAALLVVNLIPAITLLVLLGRRMAKGRAAKSAVATSGRLHVRLVALFSLVASVPMLLVVIFASLLFQYGVEFWFSDRARGMLENANSLARGYYDQNRRDVGEETITMASDLRSFLSEKGIEHPEFAENYSFQVLTRKLNESAIIQYGEDGVARTAAAVNPGNSGQDTKITQDVIDRLMGGQGYVVIAKPNKIEAVTALDLDSRVFLYAARDSDMLALSQWERAQSVLADYDILFTRSRSLQLQFNVALFFVSLFMVGLALWVALAVADRLVRPVSELVDAAKRITEGDLAARVPPPFEKDEVGTLGRAFNRMTERLETQTTALLTANEQLGQRRAFIETVLESVTAGILSLDRTGNVSLINTRAMALLAKESELLLDKQIADIAPEFAKLIEEGTENAIIQFSSVNEIRTLEVQIVKGKSGYVITFEDITQQLLDQRRAAWSDVARRIAHEIKNPLTPIQLAAERLQRRFGKNIEDGAPIFSQLTGTIIRQVGDLRNIVDEFSSFARMPKPVFREENLIDITKQAIFLQEVAHPEISFRFEADDPNVPLVCDRRQLGQALTNIVKNAVEAIEQKATANDGFAIADGEICMRVGRSDDEIEIQLDDNGVGLPAERERIIEPYMTTRDKGTGLGLAIVKKIIEEHFGDIAFSDSCTAEDGGGTRVTIRLNPVKLNRLGESFPLQHDETEARDTSKEYDS